MTRSALALPFFAAFCLLFSSCAAGSAASRAASDIPGLFASATGFTAQVAATVSRGQTENDFTLAWTLSPSGSTVEVLSPASVAGIRAEITPDARTLSYDGSALSLPDAVSPIGLLPVLADVWRGACTEYASEPDGVTLTYFETLDGHGYELRTRFDASTLRPLSAAVFADGVRVAVYTFETFAFSSD